MYNLIFIFNLNFSAVIKMLFNCTLKSKHRYHENRKCWTHKLTTYINNRIIFTLEQKHGYFLIT